MRKGGEMRKGEGVKGKGMKKGDVIRKGKGMKMRG